MERILIAPQLRPLNFWLVQDARDGALPALRAALDPAAQGGDYYGPSGWFQLTGQPVLVESSRHSHDRSARRRLWEISTQLTDVTYPIPAAATQSSHI